MQVIELLVGSFVAIFTTLLMIIYYIISKKIENIEQSTRQQAIMQKSIESMSHRLSSQETEMSDLEDDIDSNFVTEDLCEVRQQNINIQLKQLNRKLKDICKKVDKLDDD